MEGEDDEPSVERLRVKRFREKLSSPAVVMLVGDDADSLSASCSSGRGSGICGASAPLPASQFVCGGGSCGVAARVDGDSARMEMFVFARESGETGRMGGRGGSGDVDNVANGRLREDGPEEALGGRPSTSRCDGGRYRSPGEEMTWLDSRTKDIFREGIRPLRLPCAFNCIRGNWMRSRSDGEGGTEGSGIGIRPS